MTPKKRANAQAFKKERARWAKVKNQRPEKNPQYLAWIRLRWCWICEHVTGSEAGSGHIEAAHTGRRGLRQKAPDREAIPLCIRHHRSGKLSHHVLQKKFWTYYKIDRETIVKSLNQLYEQETGRKI